MNETCPSPQSARKANPREVMMCFHDLLTDVADRANLLPMGPEEFIAATLPPPSAEPLPQPAVEQPKPAARAAQNGSSTAPRNEAPLPRPTSPANGNGHAAPADRPISAPRRTSCLD